MNRRELITRCHRTREGTAIVVSGVLLAMTWLSAPGCAFLAGAAVGGGAGYVAGHEAGEDDHDHDEDDHDDDD